MLFTQFEFIFLFLPAVLLLHETLRGAMVRARLLVIASVIFYAAWDVRFLPMILLSVLGNFWIGKAVHRSRSRNVLVAGIVFNLLPLAWCKYGLFLSETFGLTVRGSAAEAFFPAAIPLGISFYTFQQIAYLVDVYQHGLVESRLDKYSFFTLFFPQLIAGPIVHHQEIIPQIGTRPDRADLFFRGLVYFLIGYVKKFIVADALGAFVDPLYASTEPLAFQGALVATLGYTFQLYFDFSGYSDMAMGLGQLFGFRLPINFNSPYKARSITDFWRRWHITLSKFLRDYLYIPLGGNRSGKLLRYRNLMLTMLLGGLWHGAGWTFVIWGGAHGLLLAIEHFARERFPRFSLGRAAGPVTFLLVALLWVPFRAESLAVTTSVYRGLLDFQGFTADRAVLSILAAGLLVLGPSSHRIVARLAELPRRIKLVPYALRRRACVYFAISHVVLAAVGFAFYTADFDRMLYRTVGVSTTTEGIENKRGDFRTNLNQQEVLYGDERKVVFVGSSFTQEMGSYRFVKDGERYKSGTLGIGGNTFVNALRSATAVMDLENLDTVVVGLSPLNLGPIRDQCAFEGQGMLGVSRLGFSVRRDPYAEVEPIPVSALDMATFLTRPGDPRFRQLHGFMFNLGTSLIRRRPEVPTLELSAADRFWRKLENELQSASDSPTPVPDSRNGNDETFRWEQRGILESVREGGDTRRALAALKRELEQRGVRLVVYDTPTPTHSAAPTIYPEGFLEQYRTEMASMADDVALEYYDLTGLFPWSGEYMNDFIHPRPESRRKLHRLLLYRLYGDQG